MKSMVKVVGMVMLLTLFSRIMALFSNQIYLVKLSVNSFMDAFSYSYQLPNIVFAGIGTALTTVVIPIIANYIETGDKKKAFGFVSNITTLSFIITVAIAIVGYFIAPVLVGFTNLKNTDAADFAVFAIRFMFPVMIFYAMTFIFQGVLQSAGRFIAPSLVSLPGSIIVILYSIFMSQKYGVKGLLFAVFIGLSLQVAIMIPSLIKAGYNFMPSLLIKDDDLRTALKLVPPVFIGTSAWQMNMLFNNTMAANFTDGATLLTLVQTLITSGVLTFVYSVTAVVFPRLTVLFANSEMDDFKTLFTKSVNSVLFVLVPLAFGFIVLSEQLLNMIYGYGKITQGNIKMAGMIMAFYSAGIIGHSIKEVADRAFYSAKDTLKPALNGLIIMAVNIIAAIILIYPLGVYGIPLAYTISLSVGAIGILFMLKKKIGSFGERALFENFMKLLFCSCVMAVGVYFAKIKLITMLDGNGIVQRAILLMIPALAGVIIYFGITVILKIPEAGDIRARFSKFLRKRAV